MRVAIAVAAATLLTGLAVPAQADALDGDWCFTDGRRLSIDGPRIVTPGGTAMTGDYRRHTFSYTVPKPEPGAGSYVFMQQWSEEIMQMHTGADEASALKAPQQTWTRCKPIS